MIVWDRMVKKAGVRDRGFRRNLSLQALCARVLVCLCDTSIARTVLVWPQGLHPHSVYVYEEGLNLVLQNSKGVCVSTRFGNYFE